MWTQGPAPSPPHPVWCKPANAIIPKAMPRSLPMPGPQGLSEPGVLWGRPRPGPWVSPPVATEPRSQKLGCGGREMCEATWPSSPGPPHPWAKVGAASSCPLTLAPVPSHPRCGSRTAGPNRLGCREEPEPGSLARKPVPRPWAQESTGPHLLQWDLGC